MDRICVLLRRNMKYKVELSGRFYHLQSSVESPDTMVNDLKPHKPAKYVANHNFRIQHCDITLICVVYILYGTRAI